MIYDVIIGGAGVIGGVLARQLSKYKLKICVLEKENDVACGASKANSGIIHGGYDPEPGTLKAKLNAEGVEKLYSLAKELNVPYKNNGSFVCAFNKEEEESLKTLYKRGLENKITGLEIIDGEKARKLEPMLSKEITAVLNVPTAGIICPYELTIASIGNAIDNGTTLITNFEISNIIKKEDLFEITSSNGDVKIGKYFINCAGCNSDKIAKLIGENSFEIIPRAGEYILLDKSEGQKICHTIFQVPSKDGKGILVSPTVDGNLLTGPTAAKVTSGNNTETTANGLELVEKLSKKSVPGINFKNTITSFTGVRASEKGQDFIIEESKVKNNFINVAAIDSPGLTSCVSIADYVIELLKNIGLTLNQKKDFCPTRKDPHFFRKMTDEEKQEYIMSHPDFGKIVCRCEEITEGEIKFAINQNPKATDVDGVKRRTRSGMGRCQGGFCSSYVLKILAKENNIAMEDVTKKGLGSYIVTGKI